MALFFSFVPCAFLFAKGRAVLGILMFSTLLFTPIGMLGIQCHEDKLVRIQYLSGNILPHPNFCNYDSLPSRLKKTVFELIDYFECPQDLLHLPYSLHGTLFQRRVWRALARIPLGEVRTYGQLAKKLNTSARAVGVACRTNPLPIVIPCHRIVAAREVGGYCGALHGDKVVAKQWLLAHEQGS